MFLLGVALILPFAAAGTVALLRKPGIPRIILMLTSCAELCLGIALSFGITDRKVVSLTSMIGADSYSVFFLIVTSFLFAMASIHAMRWIPAEARTVDSPHAADPRMSEWLFCVFLLLFFGTMALVICARNFGLLWVAVEATTLASAPLICYYRSGHSLEAMWKYLLICSVGIGFALLGTMFLSIAVQFGNAGTMEDLSFAGVPGHIHSGWFKAAFVFILAGYGTKMGLAPFHTWLPDAHSESPALVSALLSGTLLNCAFLGIIRVISIATPELQVFCRELLVAFGLFSVTVSALFIIRQTDFKRMLAYSSVEHMGILALAWGLGAAGAAVIHVAGHTLLKGMLFLIAGNILTAYGTRSVSAVEGMFMRIPKNAVLWLIGLIAICGTPPSPLFVSEFILVRTALGGGRLWVGLLLLGLLFVVFAGMSAAFFRMLSGKEGSVIPENCRLAEGLSSVPIVLCVTALSVGSGFLFMLMKGVI